MNVSDMGVYHGRDVAVGGKRRALIDGSRSASGASGRSPRALAERRVRTPELAFPDAGCDTADVLRRLEGAIERTSGVAASPALGTLRNFGEVFAPTSKQRGKKITPRCSRRWRGGVGVVITGNDFTVIFCVQRDVYKYL